MPTPKVDFDFLRPPQVPGDLGQLGPYRILKVLGRGGMGMVFLAVDDRLHRQVALKVMLPDLARKPEAKERFLREARAAAAIEHDHIVTIYQVDEDNGVPFMAMSLLQGCTLEDVLRPKNNQRAGPMQVARILKIGRELARGLAVAHQKGLVHRDIKPSNLWLDSAAGGRLKILDFGLARWNDPDEKHLTQVGTVLGTPTYMSPEQARAEKVNFKTDLFSMGVVLYRLCAGELPFRGNDAMTTLMAVLMHLPPPPVQVNPLMPQKLSDLVMRLLAKSARERPASAQAVVEELTALEHDLSRAAPEPTLLSFPGAPLPAPPAHSTLALSQPGAGAGQRRVWPWLAGAGGLLAVVLVFLLTRSTATLGTLTITSEVGEVEVLVQGHGPTLKAKPGEHRLPAGEYTLALVDQKPGWKLSLERLKLDPEAPAALRVLAEVTKTPPVTKEDAARLEGNRKVVTWLTGVESYHYSIRTKDSKRLFVSARKPLDFQGDFTFVSIWLQNCSQLNDQSLENLQTIRELSNLKLPPRIGDGGLRMLTTIPGLKDLQELSLVGTRITDDGLDLLTGFKHLAALDLDKTTITDKGLAKLGQALNLETLSVRFTQVSPVGLETLRTNRRLKTLHLDGLPITDKDLLILLDFPSLTNLSLKETLVTDQGMKTLAHLPLLENLELSSTKVAKKGLEDLTKLRRLTSLNLKGTELTDEGLDFLKGLPGLKNLYLENTRISNKAIGILGSLTRLSLLDLDHTSVDDGCLKDLVEMKQLGNLFLTGTKISEEGLAKLKAALPTTIVSHYSGSSSTATSAFAKGKVTLRKDEELTAQDGFDVAGRGRSKRFLVMLEKDKEYQMDLLSTAFDPVLRVEDQRGKQLAKNDDGGEGLNARLRFIAPASGQYFLVATSYDATGLGRFTLQVQEKE